MAGYEVLQLLMAVSMFWATIAVVLPVAKVDVVEFVHV
jgi:hypothetical protein